VYTLYIVFSGSIILGFQNADPYVKLFERIAQKGYNLHSQALTTRNDLLDVHSLRGCECQAITFNGRPPNIVGVLLFLSLDYDAIC